MQPEVYAIKSKIINRIIFVIVVFLSPAYVTALLRWIELGWQNINIVHSVLYFYMIFLTIKRNKISFIFKVYSLVVVFAVLGLAGLWFFGFSGIHYFVIISLAIVSVYTSRKSAMIFISLISVLYIGIGLLYTNNVINTSVDMNLFLHSKYQWITIVLSVFAFSAIFIIGFGELSRELINNIEERDYVKRQLELKNYQLESSHEKLDKTISELRTLNQTKDKFFSILAHDLKSPFSSILGLAGLLDDDFDKYDTEHQKIFIGLIHKGIENANNLIDDLLLWSRAQRDIIEFKPQHLNLFLLATKVKNILQVQADKKSVEICVEVDPELEADVDEFIVRTILRNLVSNAIKFSHQNLGKVTIFAGKINEDTEDECIEFCVSDNGTGIPAEMLPRIFDVGKNVSTPGTEDERGTGLGLPICYEFVKKHGGDIRVKSREKGGTSFFVTLPAHFSEVFV